MLTNYWIEFEFACLERQGLPWWRGLQRSARTPTILLKQGTKAYRGSCFISAKDHRDRLVGIQDTSGENNNTDKKIIKRRLNFYKFKLLHGSRQIKKYHV